MNWKRFYTEVLDPRKREYQNTYERYLKNRKTILDVGCGVGNFINLSPTTIQGIDHNDESLKVAKQRGFRVKKGKATKLPFKPRTFDAVFCAHVIEHLSQTDAVDMLYEFDRILKKDGLIVLKTPLDYSRFYNELTHIRPYPPEAILDYMQKNSPETTQRTFQVKNIFYELVSIEYRYDTLYYPFVEPAHYTNSFQRNWILFWKLAAIVLFTVGIKNYFVKTGYTIVLRKTHD